MSYLVGDIGGTRVRLRLIDRGDGEWRTLHEQRSLSADSASASAAPIPPAAPVTTHTAP